MQGSGCVLELGHPFCQERPETEICQTETETEQPFVRCARTRIGRTLRFQAHLEGSIEGEERRRPSWEEVEEEKRA